MNERIMICPSGYQATGMFKTYAEASRFFTDKVLDIIVDGRLVRDADCYYEYDFNIKEGYWHVYVRGTNKVDIKIPSIGKAECLGPK